MIKAVIFDYGGVMTHGGRGTELTERLASELGVTEQRAFEILGTGWDEYSSGRISEDALWKLMEAEYGQPIPLEKRDIWNPWEVMRPLAEMVGYVKRLKSEGLKVGLLSNVIPNTMRQIQEHGGYDIFDFTVLSADVGFGKPEPDIYQLVLNELSGIRPDEVIFIDDHEKFLVPARAIGIQTVLAVSSAQIITETNQLIEKYIDET